MGALAALGIALGVLFGVFLLILAGEILYMAWWSKQRKKVRDSKSVTWCWNGVSNAHAQHDGPSKEAIALDMAPAYCHEAALVGSFGGYPSFSPVHMLLAAAEGGGRFLFSIAEETKEDLAPPPEQQQVAKEEPASKKGFSCESLPSFSNSATASLSTSTARSSSASCCSSVGNHSLPATPFATPPTSVPSSPSASASPSSSFSTATSRLSSPPSDAP